MIAWQQNFLRQSKTAQEREAAHEASLLSLRSELKKVADEASQLRTNAAKDEEVRRSLLAQVEKGTARTHELEPLGVECTALRADIRSLTEQCAAKDLQIENLRQSLRQVQAEVQMRKDSNTSRSPSAAASVNLSPHSASPAPQPEPTAVTAAAAATATVPPAPKAANSGTPGNKEQWYRMALVSSRDAVAPLRKELEGERHNAPDTSNQCSSPSILEKLSEVEQVLHAKDYELRRVLLQKKGLQEELERARHTVEELRRLHVERQSKLNESLAPLISMFSNFSGYTHLVEEVYDAKRHIAQVAALSATLDSQASLCEQLQVRCHTLESHLELSAANGMRLETENMKLENALKEKTTAGAPGMEARSTEESQPENSMAKQEVTVEATLPRRRPIGRLFHDIELSPMDAVDVKDAVGQSAASHAAFQARLSQLEEKTAKLDALRSHLLVLEDSAAGASTGTFRREVLREIQDVHAALDPSSSLNNNNNNSRSASTEARLETTRHDSSTSPPPATFAECGKLFSEAMHQLRSIQKDQGKKNAMENLECCCIFSRV